MAADALYRQALAYTAEGLRAYGYVTRTDLSCVAIRDATVTSRRYFPNGTFVGAVYDGRGALVRSTLRYNQGDIVPVDTARLDDLSALSARTSPHPAALYGGILFSSAMGHFLLESLARLWPLLWGGAAGPVLFHSWPGQDFAGFMANPLFRGVLGAFGLHAGNVELIEAPLRLDTLLVPMAASTYHLNLDQRMAAVFDLVSARLAGPGGGARRVFLSRSKWGGRPRILNEDAIDALMAARGFEVTYPETLAPETLMATLRDAAVLVATDGSHAHLAAFCRPGIRTVLLDTRPVPSQFAIAVLRGFRAVHVPLFQMPFYRWEGAVDDPALLGQVIDLALA